MTSGIEEHGGFPGYYVVLGLLTFYPWSALLPAALVGGLGAGAGSRRVFGFLLGWMIGPLDPARVRADQADPLLPARLPRLGAADRLAGWSPWPTPRRRAPRATGGFGRVLRSGRSASVGLGAVAGLLAAAWLVPPAPARAAPGPGGA